MKKAHYWKTELYRNLQNDSQLMLEPVFVELIEN